MMHIKINYGSAVTTVPSVDLAILSRATADDLRILLCLCRSDIRLSGENIDALAASLGQAAACSAVTAATSISFWRGTGVLNLTEDEEAMAPVPPSSNGPSEPSAVPPEKTPPRSRVTVKRATGQLPSYSHADLANLLDSRPETQENIHEIEQLWGNLLNLQEVNTVLELSDYLGLDWDYILSLIARCVEDMDRLNTKHSMRYVEKQAIRFYDEGITTLDALQEKFRALDILHSAEGKLRTLFGMGTRIMTPSETKFFSTWLYDFRYDYDIIELAYTIAVDAKGEPKKSYINSILANWNSQNLRTIAEIEASQAAFRAEQERKRTGNTKTVAPPAGGGSFDTENFFDAAVRRSLGDPAES